MRAVRFSARLLALVAVGCVVACGGTTAEDRERLELLKNDPLFDYAPPDQTPDDVTSTLDILADGDNPISDTIATTHEISFALGPMDDHVAIIREIEGLLIDQGWQDLTARCWEFEVRVLERSSSTGSSPSSDRFCPPISTASMVSRHRDRACPFRCRLPITPKRTGRSRVIHPTLTASTRPTADSRPGDRRLRALLKTQFDFYEHPMHRTVNDKR